VYNDHPRPRGGRQKNIFQLKKMREWYGNKSFTVKQRCQNLIKILISPKILVFHNFFSIKMAKMAVVGFISFITTQHQDTQYNILNAHDILESDHSEIALVLILLGRD
jgi:hypothetical protein